MIGLRPIRSDSQPNRMKNGVPIEAGRDHDLRRDGRHFQRLGQEEQRVELPAIPDDGLAGVAPSSARIAILRLAQLPKASVSGRLEPLPSSFIFKKTGDKARRIPAPGRRQLGRFSCKIAHAA